MKHYLQFKDLRAEEYAYLFERAASSRRASRTTRSYQPLADRTLAMIFEKASTRTRVSFEAGMYQMGGSVVHLTTGDSQLGRAEPIEDSARVISRMVDLVMIRTYEQTKIERFAAHSRVPVINGLTNEYHPCQILADIFTFIEHRGSHPGQGGGLGGRRQQHGQHLAAGGRDPGLHGARQHAQRLRGRPRPWPASPTATATRSSTTRCRPAKAPTW
jgi:ornithine carbamoyltransferase